MGELLPDCLPKLSLCFKWTFFYCLVRFITEENDKITDVGWVVMLLHFFSWNTVNFEICCNSGKCKQIRMFVKPLLKFRVGSNPNCMDFWLASIFISGNDNIVSYKKYRSKTTQPKLMILMSFSLTRNALIDNYILHGKILKKINHPNFWATMSSPWSKK